MMENGDDHTICDKIPAVKSANHDTKVDMDVLKSNTDTTDKLKAKCDVLVDDDDKCVNNQDICNNRKNVKAINKTDCNVVIDDGTKQSKQQQQQSNQPDEPQSMTPSPPLPPSSQENQQQQKQQSTYGCVHYKRKAKFVVSQRIIWFTFSFLFKTLYFFKFPSLFE